MTDFSWTKSQFRLPEGQIYLDGNSLGPMAKRVGDRLSDAVEREWGEMLIGGWNRAGWMEQPTRVGNRIARLIGAPDGTVVAGDTLSIKIFQALAAALALRPERKVVLSDTGNFPSDLYMANGLIRMLGQGHELKTVAPESVCEHIDQNVAVVLLTHVDYRTGRMHDMQSITQAAHVAGSLMIWDLAHSAGAMELDLAGCNVDLAAGCTYKYLNGGPGAPAFIYIRPDLVDSVEPALAGWLGHESPFAFERDYRSGPGIERMRVGTPAVLQMTALEAALEIWDQVDMRDLRARSVELCEIFIAEIESRTSQLRLLSPRDPQIRGSQISFRFPNGYAAIQASIERGVIGDFRAPDVMRFGIAPLFLDEWDIRRAAGVIAQVIEEGLWNDERLQQRAAVT